jgi:hypothetical protein
MRTKKNRPYRSGSTQHYEEKLFQPSKIKTGLERYCLKKIEKSLTFFSQMFLATKTARNLTN